MGVSGGERAAEIRRLRARRPRRPLVRWSVAVLGGLVVWAWTSGAFALGALWTARSRENLDRFLTELRPWPLQGRAWDWGIWGGWVRGRFGPVAGEAVGATVALSVAAIVLAAAAAFFFSLAAARNLAEPEPFVGSPRPPSGRARGLARVGVFAVRAVLVFLRAVPEYIWAFLLLALLGVGPWPAVLALAIHNTGILGKLFAEVTETMDPAPAEALRAVGAGRAALVPAVILPRNLNRWLLYFFYRWETCVREATVLGLLGVVSLGWYIQDARAGVRYDEMVGYVALGSGIILAGDWVSGRVRGRLRRG